jgi:hypothetical protein
MQNELITFHTFLEAIGIVTVAVLVLGPVYGMLWDVSAARTRRRLAEEKSKAGAR